MRFWKNPHVHGPIDATSCIPARVRFFGVIGDHFDVICAIFDIGGRLKNEICIAIFSMTGFLSVNDDCWMSINTFEFKEDGFPIFKKDIEIFFVNIFTTSKERDVHSARIVDVSVCREHTVIG